MRVNRRLYYELYDSSTKKYKLYWTKAKARSKFWSMAEKSAMITWKWDKDDYKVSSIQVIDEAFIHEYIPKEPVCQ